MANPVPYSLRDLLFYFLKLGTLGWGGPVALVGYMHRDLVIAKNWISEEDYKEGLTLAQLAPGPLAAQLAIYMGYIHYKLRGATLVGIVFVLPSFLMVVALGIAYVQYEGLPLVQGLFYGIGACVIGVISVSSWKLISKTVDWSIPTIGIFLLLAVTTFVTESEIIWLVIASGLFMLIVKGEWRKRKETALVAPLFLHLSLVTTDSSTWKMILFFGSAGAFVFGSGLAIVPFLYGGVVKEFGWLTEQQFVDAVAVAMITPGPVVITVGFIGYLVDGFSGACVASLATFLPCYFFTILPAPYMKKYGKYTGLRIFIEGVTVAAIGAIAGAVLVIGKRTLVDGPTIAIALLTVTLLVVFKKLKEPWLILGSAGLGLIIKNFYEN